MRDSGPAVTPQRAATSERRPLTILFADIAGSTTIAEKLDPEDWTVLVQQAFDRLNTIASRYGGTVARLMGDGVLVFFGAPVAHEDDPERAVRCGLDMVREIGGLGGQNDAPHSVPLQVRVGINTGPVVVGMVGSDVAREYTAMGDAVNVAARMQASAPPGGVMITAATYKFIAPLVDAIDAGALELKGKSETVHGYQVTGLRRGAVSARGLGDEVHSAMIGRDPQLARLRETFAIVRARQGRVASILGEPGIGKSRLLAELRAHVSGADPTAQWLEARCLSYGRGLPYHLVVDLVRSAIGVAATADEPEIRVALEGRTKALFGDAWLDPYIYLGHLLSIQLSPEQRARMSALDLETLKRYTSSIVGVVKASAAKGPVVIALEDLHWADGPSIDLLLGLMPLANELPLMVVATSRFDRESEGWRLISAVRDLFGEALLELRLDPLSGDDTRTLVANLLHIESLPQATREHILTKAEGNPFFVEEVIRMLIDRGAIERRDDRWLATARVADVEIPDTLQGLLLARIDRLPPESKRTLRVAAVIGRQFGVAMLERLLEARTE
ncbi:MAG TPA: adenylate/guanylate cyclase domain-containing protein [Patescibacteria group bacterium]|jgi:class 3 adenylate cyclase|nr:adenylate/guanylate cyclase domain-containing protein [Patescibacteria group bacterium]